MESNAHGFGLDAGCELDPLRDQGEMFGARLVAAGVPVGIRRELGMVHNFLLWDLVAPSCSKAADRGQRPVILGIGNHKC
jgi:acetyl esterase/lipase